MFHHGHLRSDDNDDEARLQKAAVEFADKLQLSNIPQVSSMSPKLSISHQALPCRDEERRSVYSFLWEAVNTGGAGNVLYISGMPGTGDIYLSLHVWPHVVGREDCNRDGSCGRVEDEDE